MSEGEGADLFTSLGDRCVVAILEDVEHEGRDPLHLLYLESARR